MRFRYPYRGVVAADGTASLLAEPRGHVDLVVLAMTVAVTMPDGSEPPLQSTALVYSDGTPLEGSYSGNNDADNQLREIMRPGNQLECRWSGATPGAIATLIIRGQQYPFGRGPQE